MLALDGFGLLVAVILVVKLFLELVESVLDLIFVAVAKAFRDLRPLAPKPLDALHQDFILLLAPLVPAQIISNFNLTRVGLR